MPPSLVRELMVIDLRKQRRVIKIKLEQTGGKTDLDDFVDGVANDLEIILEQRAKPNNIKMEVILE